MTARNCSTVTSNFGAEWRCDASGRSRRITCAWQSTAVTAFIGDECTTPLTDAVDPAAQEPRIDAGGTQAQRRRPADFVTVHAVHDHLGPGRELARPLRNLRGIAPFRAGNRRR